MPGFKEVGEILSIINSSSCDEFILETQDIKLVVRRGGRAGSADGVAPSGPVAQAGSAPVSSPSTGSSAAARPAAAPADDGAGLQMIRAPSVGTFYRAPAPDQPPFVEVGSTVKQGDPVCMIEVMKLFTTVHAETDGVIAAINAENGHLVEFGQVLFRIDGG